MDPDVVHYQMLFQIWRNKPGVSAARSVVLTPSLLLLCEEDLSSVDVHLKILDTAFLKDVWKITPEANPLQLTFIFKPTSVFATRRKWRLRADSRQAMAKLEEECRRVCTEANNPGV